MRKSPTGLQSEGSSLSLFVAMYQDALGLFQETSENAKRIEQLASNTVMRHLETTRKITKRSKDAG